MAVTPQVRSTQGGVFTASSFTPKLRTTQALTLTAINFPTESIRTTQDGIMAGALYTPKVRTSQARVLAAVKGRVANPKLRAWTYTLDGHDMYVLRLGESETLVYDTYSEKWSTYTSGSRATWQANTGINWLGAVDYAYQYGSNVLIGDDTYGLLWFLDPTQAYDNHPRSDVLDPQPFTRIVMGQIPLSGRDKTLCHQVFLSCDLGEPSIAGANVTLYTSDDLGNTFDNQGTVTITPGNFSQEVYWSSLGQIRAPGRLFKIVDDGAITSIYGLDMRDGG